MLLTPSAIRSSIVAMLTLLVVPLLADDAKVDSIAGLFSVTDPDKDCEFSLLGDNLVITVPPVNHNLHPVRGMNAPRVLKKVSGDFTVSVKVTSEFKPGTKSTKIPGQGNPFNGAGILIWENADNYMRVERNAYWSGKSLLCYPPLIEYWHNKAYAGFNNDPISADYFKGNSTWLKARRDGKDVIVSISHDGTEWAEVKKVKIEMGNDISIGVDALNSSDLPFSVEFEEFKIEAK